MLRHTFKRRCYSSYWNEASCKNDQSTARDHLANERTFLAWARTGLASMGAGIALFTSYAMNFDAKRPCVNPHDVMPSSALLIGNGIGILVFGVHRYFSVIAALEGGNFVIAKRRFLAVVGLSSAVTTVALYRIYALEVEKVRQAVKQEEEKKK